MAGQPPLPSELEITWRVAAQLLSGELLTEQYVHPGISVAQLRKAIVEAAGIGGSLRLVHNGAPLAEEQSVADAGLGDGATLVAVRVAGIRLACSSASCNGVSVWSFDGAGPPKTPHTCGSPSEAVWSMALSPDGARLALGSVEDYPGENFAMVSLWHVETGRQECAWQLQKTSRVHCVAFSPDGKSLAAGFRDDANGSVAIWGLDALQQRAQLDLGLAPYTVAYSPCGHRLVTGGYSVAKVWEVDACRCIGTFAEHTDMVLRACFSPDGALVATASEDCTAMLWSPVDFTRVATFSGHQDRICGVGFSPDGALLVTASSDSTARVWEVGSGRCVRTLDCPQDDVRFAAFSPDGALIFTGSDCTVRVWSAETGRSMAEYEGQAPMAVSPEV